MRTPRIYHPDTLLPDREVRLTEEAAGHVGRVLRMSSGQPLLLFDNRNLVFDAVILHADKRTITVKVVQGREEDHESPLHLHLGQVISRGEKMEFTIQKSTELGVNIITPLYSVRCGVKLDAERMAKKLQQWQKIAIAACEQCGRNRIPLIRQVMTLEQWCAEEEPGLKLTLHPHAQHTINTLPPQAEKIRLLIGPEGGLTAEETDSAAQQGFSHISLGPRILRTETAALTAITALQARFGDLG